VRQVVCRIRAEIVQPEGESLVPQVHQGGHEAEAAFGDLIAGVVVTLWIFSLRDGGNGVGGDPTEGVPVTGSQSSRVITW